MSYYYTPSPPTTTYPSSSSYSRPNSVSPQFSHAFPVVGTFFGSNPQSKSCKQRYNASRGFEIEDDLEFCPALTSDRSSSSSSVSSDSSDYHEYTTRPLGSPISSPAKTNAILTSVTGSPSTPVISRVRKVIEIVDPTTGLRVSSPPTPTGLRRS